MKSAFSSERNNNNNNNNNNVIFIIELTSPKVSFSVALQKQEKC